MKFIKLYSILLFYLVMYFIVASFLEKTYIELVKQNCILVLGYSLVFLLLFVITFYLWLIKLIVPYSVLVKQVILSIMFLYSQDFLEAYQYLFFSITILLFYLIYRLSNKSLVYYNTRVNYRLSVRNSILLNSLYIGYGGACYGLFILSKKDIEHYFDNITDAFYVSLMPYIIIISFLYMMQFDSKTDKINTNKQYKLVNFKKLFLRNIIITFILVFLLLYE